MMLEQVLPALRDGKAIQRASQPIKWAYLKRSPNGAFHWYGFGDDPTRGSPMNIDHVAIEASDWVIVDEAQTVALKPASTFSCARRGGSFRAPADGQFLDHWRENAHNTQGGKHSCSYCGSIHPDEFMQAVRDGVEIGPTDKNYKAYLSGPGFDNAKFYFQHLSEAQMQEFVELLNAKSVKIGLPGHFYTRPYFISYAGE